MLAIRARIQRRRWRAPKSVIESLPVRIYSTPEGSPLDTPPPSPPPTTTGDDDAGDNTPQEQAPQPKSKKKQKQQSQIRLTSSTPTSSLECVVCLEDYVPGVSRVMKLPCGHEFHVGCITPWLVTRRRTCPICKGDVVKMFREKGGHCDDIERGHHHDGENSEQSRSPSPRWRNWILGVVGGGRGRSIRSLVHRDGDRVRGGSRRALGAAGSSRREADETTPLMLAGESSLAGERSGGVNNATAVI